MLPRSARELGDSGRIRPAIRMMKPGTAADRPQLSEQHDVLESVSSIEHLLEGACLMVRVGQAENTALACGILVISVYVRFVFRHV